jgi:stage II sporulation protein AA (anti-sigma F factor antagonist)
LLLRKKLLENNKEIFGILSQSSYNQSYQSNSCIFDAADCVGGLFVEINICKRKNTLVVRFDGELDQHSADYIRKRIDAEIIRPGIKNIIFDLEKLTFMDSAGIGVLLGRTKHIFKFGGQACLASADAQIMRIIRLSGIQKLFKICDNVDEALDGLVN